jgi:VanZ family protein
VSDLQPWNNPRNAPHLPGPQNVFLRQQNLPWLWPGLRAWWPAIAWACVIFSMSTDTFSSEHTASILEPLFRWLLPQLSEDQFALIHHVIRKTAHFTEYFIFCVLLYRGVRGNRKGWRWTWGLAALFLAAGYSALDEIHQAFVVSRTASAYDSLLDSAGAFVAVAALYLWFRMRPSQSACSPVPAPNPKISG